MTRVHYELGLSGRDVCASCRSLPDLFRAGDQLAPGDYWIQEITEYSSTGWMWYLDSEPRDWGTLDVRGPDDWLLRSLDGMLLSPGYVIV